MVSRRDFLGITLGAGATLALTPELLRALQQSGGKLIQRAVPSTGEMLPVVGLGRGWSPSLDHAAVKEAVKALVDNGGRVLDTVHGAPPARQLVGTIAEELGVQNQIFWSTGMFVPGGPAPAPGTAGPPPKADPAAVKAEIERLFAMFRVPRIDLIQVLAHADLPTHLAELKALKKEGRVRYIGVTTIAPQYAKLEAAMRNEPIDFVGIDYAIDHRGVEETILPLARERKIGVLAYFPFGNNSLFRRVGATPVPEWAADFDARTWAQFFLKYVVSHPAVTVVRTGTSQAKHMLDNLGGGVGRLPDEATRRRMAAFIDSLPQPAARAGGPPPQPPQGPVVVLSAAILDRYLGEYKSAAGTIVTFRRDGATLFVKPGTNPEAALIARSETRLQDPRGPVFEFQLDGLGKVSGAILEQGAQRLPLARQ